MGKLLSERLEISPLHRLEKPKSVAEAAAYQEEPAQKCNWAAVEALSQARIASS